MNKVQMTAAILTVAAASVLSPAFADNNVANAEETKMMSCMKDGKAMDATDAKDCEGKGGKMMEKAS